MAPAPQTLTVYGYMKCDACRKALRWLDDAGRKTSFIDITTDPPPASLLKSVLAGGRYELKHLFNTSGQLYREMAIKDRLPHLSPPEALALLADHGKLIKRPLVTDGQHHTVGFKPDVFAEVWGR